MKKRLLWLIVSSFVFVNAVSAGDWIDRVVDLTIRARFNEALKVIKPRLARPDSSLDGYFYLASLYNSMCTHYESMRFFPLLKEAVDSVQSSAQRRLQQSALENSRKARILFYQGSALGFLAFLQGRQGSWLQALRNGVRSINLLEDALALDSTLYDAYLGIGAYKYWRSTRLRFLTWTPFVEDEREQGICMIRKAWEKSQHSRYFALHQLVYILVNNHQRQEAVRLAREGVRKFPQSPFMWWALGHALFMKREHGEAIQVFEHILDMVRRGEDDNPAHAITAHNRLSEIYYRMGKKKGACLEALKAQKVALRLKRALPTKTSWLLKRACGEGR